MLRWQFVDGRVILKKISAPHSLCFDMVRIEVLVSIMINPNQHNAYHSANHGNSEKGFEMSNV